MTPNNGYFTTKEKVGGGFNEDGQPVKVDESTTEQFDCHIQKVTDNKRGVYEDGKFINSSYVLFIPHNTSFNVTNIEIFKNENSVGKFVVQSIEHLMLVGRTVITV